MSAIDNSEVTCMPVCMTMNEEPGTLLEGTRTSLHLPPALTPKPKRILHFSDGKLEEDVEENDVEERTGGPSTIQGLLQQGNTESGPPPPPQPQPIDPGSLSWGAWTKYNAVRGGVKTLEMLDSVGETLAYCLGVTTPKYGYEIDEFHRLQEVARKKEREVELASWTTGQGHSNPSSPQPIQHQKDILRT